MRQFLRECAWIGKYSLQYKWQVIWYTFLGLLGTVMSLAGSVASKYVIDAVTGNDSHVLIAAAVFCIPITQFIKAKVQTLPEEKQAICHGCAAVMNVAILFLCTALLVGQSYNPFLYFRF